MNYSARYIGEILGETHPGIFWKENTGVLGAGKSEKGD